MMAKRLQAFRFELMPNGEQERSMRQFAGARRRVYNDALNLQQQRHARGEKNLSYVRAVQGTHLDGGPRSPGSLMRLSMSCSSR